MYTKNAGIRAGQLYLNRNGEIIPENIIHQTTICRSCAPIKKTATAYPIMPVLDKVLYQYIEKRKGPKELIAMGIDEALVRRILKMVNSNEYKRNQFCPIIRVSCKAFGVGRRVPIVGKYLS